VNLEKEAQCRHRAVDRRRAAALLAEMQLEAPQILGRGRRRRASQKVGERLDATNVVALGGGGEVADGHVLDHAPPQRADGHLGHRRLLS